MRTLSRTARATALSMCLGGGPVAAVTSIIAAGETPALAAPAKRTSPSSARAAERAGARSSLRSSRRVASAAPASAAPTEPPSPIACSPLVNNPNNPNNPNSPDTQNGARGSDGGAGSDDLAGRRAIRGETVAPAHESEALRLMRRFEEERFGRGSAGPGALRFDGGDEPPVPWASLVLPDIGVRWDPRLVRFLEFYRGDRRGRGIMSSWLKAEGRYRELIEQALVRHHLPHALLYVAMIESGFDPLDSSSAGAAGLWQLMPDGGRIYGLRIDHFVDERNDPEKATEATMRYLGDLYARFGSWPLALAAFNAGYGAVLSSVAKYNTNDYYQLCRHEDGLPWETVVYVPKVLASAIVGENRAAFGYGKLEEAAPLRFERALVPSSAKLEVIARAAAVSVEQVAALNPELVRGRTPPEPYAIRLPPKSGARFLAAFEKQREKIEPYEVRPGDRLEGIARAHGSSVHELKALNGFHDANEVRPGLTMLVPSRKAQAATQAQAGAHGSGDAARGGDEEKVLVPVPDKDAVVPGRARVFYRVATGDALDDIARYFAVSTEELRGWNLLDPGGKLLPGQVVQVFAAPELFGGSGPGPAALDASRVELVTVGSEEFFERVEARRGRRRVVIEAKAGDTLKKIGARYHLTEGDLERINRLPRTTELVAGQKLTVYVPAPNGGDGDSDDKDGAEGGRGAQDAGKGPDADALLDPGFPAQAAPTDGDEPDEPFPPPEPLRAAPQKHAAVSSVHGAKTASAR